MSHRQSAPFGYAPCSIVPDILPVDTDAHEQVPLHVTTAEADPTGYVPGAHPTHAVAAVVVETVPDAQGAHNPAVVFEKVPAAQDAHAVAAVVLEVPGAQPTHVVAVVVLEKVPGAQDTHAVAAVVLEKVPGPQFTHVVLEMVFDDVVVLDMVPDAQDTHAVAAVVVETVPAAQTSHEALPVLFLYVPATQDTHGPRIGPVYPALHVVFIQTVAPAKLT